MTGGGGGGGGCFHDFPIERILSRCARSVTRTHFVTVLHVRSVNILRRNERMANGYISLLMKLLNFAKHNYGTSQCHKYSM